MDLADPIVRRAPLCAQVAFVGKISSKMRAAVLSVTPGNVEVRCYFDGPIDEEDAESVSFAETEMMAQFEPEVTVSARCIRLDAPELITGDGLIVYGRRESTV